VDDATVAIVGAGPAGLATALALARAAPRLAERVVVLEKERHPREKICAGAIGARADRVLADLGVRVDVPSVAVRGLSVRAGGRALTARRGTPAGRVVRRDEHDAALADAARTRGIRIVEGTRVTGIALDGRGVRVATSQGELRARAVVGADGVGSAVRRALGLGRGRLVARAAEVDTEPVDSDGPRDVLAFDLEERGLVGYAWDFPTVAGGRELVCRGVYELAVDGLGEPDGVELGARLARRLRALGLDPAAHRIKRFAERGLAPAEAIAAPRVLLVGEAAGIDPALGEGIAQAIEYGAVAGPYLARRLEDGRLGFEDFRRELGRSRLGFDLAVRARALPFVYGRGRGALERWVTSSEDLALAGMRWWAGERVPRWPLARAAVALGRAAIGG
jgi:flavin-dependent dehydrogenase